VGSLIARGALLKAVATRLEALAELGMARHCRARLRVEQRAEVPAPVGAAQETWKPPRVVPFTVTAGEVRDTIHLSPELGCVSCRGVGGAALAAM